VREGWALLPSACMRASGRHALELGVDRLGRLRSITHSLQRAPYDTTRGTPTCNIRDMHHAMHDMQHTARVRVTVLRGQLGMNGEVPGLLY